MDIFDTFRANANPEQAAKMSAYMRDMFPFLGLPTPERKKLSRELLKTMGKQPADWAFVFECWEQSEREYQYLATDYLLKIADTLTADDIPKLRELIVQKSWWDTIDALDVIVGGIALRFPEVNEIVLAWSVEENFWLRRVAIDHQLGRKDKTDFALLSQIIINNLGQTEFFINKAIGWSLREYSKTNPERVRAFIDEHRAEMVGLSVREASKYIQTARERDL
ncbi:MAG: DNA alkylation repair protein [Oscillospiraceae bacterium]|nr:DNA alkylation repair protein [Oscillospiraceae bacterium]